MEMRLSTGDIAGSIISRIADLRGSLCRSWKTPAYRRADAPREIGTDPLIGHPCRPRCFCNQAVQHLPTPPSAIAGTIGGRTGPWRSWPRIPCLAYLALGGHHPSAGARRHHAQFRPRISYRRVRDAREEGEDPTAITLPAQEKKKATRNTCLRETARRSGRLRAGTAMFLSDAAAGHRLSVSA